MFDTLHRLTTPGLRDFAVLCRQRPGTEPPPAHVLQQLVGAELGDLLGQELHRALQQGWCSEHVADVADEIARARLTVSAFDQHFDLVLSGPEVPGVAMRDTAAVVHALLSEAHKEVLLVGYAIDNARQLFEPLGSRLASEPGLRVWFCLDIKRKQTDTSIPSEIVQRFAHDFTTRHWPWNPKPEVYYDPRSLEPHGPRRSSLHAKCVVIDRRAALITSANFTEAAQKRNIECGVVIRDEAQAGRIHRYFALLCESKQLRRCEIEPVVTSVEAS